MEDITRSARQWFSANLWSSFPCKFSSLFNDHTNSLLFCWYTSRFSDQYDNAQRLDEKKFGIRLDPHTFAPDQLVAAIEQLLGDQELKERLRLVAERIKRERSKDRACLAIETMVAEFQEAQQKKI